MHKWVSQSFTSAGNIYVVSYFYTPYIPLVITKVNIDNSSLKQILDRVRELTRLEVTLAARGLDRTAGLAKALSEALCGAPKSNPRILKSADLLACAEEFQQMIVLGLDAEVSYLQKSFDEQRWMLDIVQGKVTSSDPTSLDTLEQVKRALTQQSYGSLGYDYDTYISNKTNPILK